jgi:hypothetical protein
MRGDGERQRARGACPHGDWLGCVKASGLVTCAHRLSHELVNAGKTFGGVVAFECRLCVRRPNVHSGSFVEDDAQQRPVDFKGMLTVVLDEAEFLEFIQKEIDS